MFREYLKKRNVKCLVAIDGLTVGETYTVYQEIKPKVWKDGWQVDDPQAPTLYTVCMNDSNNNKIEHVDASLFEIVTMQKVVYNGGWGSPHFSCNWSEIHEPLQKGGVYDVIAVEELQTLGLPEYVYELRLPDGSVVEYANSAHFGR